VPPVDGETGAVWHGDAVFNEDAGNRVLPWPADGGFMGDGRQDSGEGAVELPRVILEELVSPGTV
jgi:hypothetical protein